MRHLLQYREASSNNIFCNMKINESIFLVNKLSNWVFYTNSKQTCGCFSKFLSKDISKQCLVSPAAAQQRVLRQRF